jgi:hypothetical protein
MRARPILSAVAGCALVAGALTVVLAGSAAAVNAGDEATFRTEFANAAQTQIDLTADITLTCGAPTNDAAVRTDGVALLVDGHGFSITQTCAGSGVLENVGNAAGALTLTNVTISGGTKTQSSDTVINGGGVYSITGLTLNGVVVTGNTVTGLGGNGGGVAGGPLTITASQVTGNTAEKNGGGIQVRAGEPFVLTGTTVSGNTTTTQGVGGFAAATQSTTDITDSIIRDNHSLTSFGGGGVAGVGPNTITRSTFDNNDASAEGGGVRLAGPTTVVGSTFSANEADSGGGILSFDNLDIASSTFTGNRAPGGGAGARIVDGDVTVTDSTFSGNQALGGDTNGGALLTIGDGSMTSVTGSTFDNNAADYGGAGIHVIGAGTSTTIVDTTITQNTVVASNAVGTERGGGVVVETGDLTIAYATIVGNSAPNGANIAFDTSGTLTSFGSVISSPAGGGTDCQLGNAVSASEGYNFADDTSCAFGEPTDRQAPGLVPLLAALADNGGPTQTLLPITGSPLIDAIPTAACETGSAAGVTTDQRGIARPQADGCDIGAVEVIPAIALNPTFTG